jgi:hypothetical protein
MKYTFIFDIAFIAISAGIFTLINYFGYAELLSKYVVVVALAAYFAGKSARQLELKRNDFKNKAK